MTVEGMLNGIHVALITPFDKNGSLDSDRARALIERHIELGVNGFFVCGSSGEGYLQSLDERREYMQFVADVTQKRATLIAQVGALTSQDAWTLAEYAAVSEYDVISSTPPFYYSYSSAELVAYYEDLASRSSLPLLLYNAPHTTGFNLSLDVQLELLNLPTVIGSKHTSSDLFSAERLIRGVQGTQIINGPDETLVAGLSMGMAAGIGTTYNFMPRHFLDIYKHVAAGDMESARASQGTVNAIVLELIKISPSVIPGVKLALEVLGFDVGRARKPFQKITADTKLFEKLLVNCGGI